MSLHNDPNYQIPALVAALKHHCLAHDTPSQLADAFRCGWVAALAAPAHAVPASLITASIMRDDGGEHPVFCLMVAYRAEKDATSALAMLTNAPAQPRDDAVFVVWWSDHMPNSTEADAWAEWCALRSNQPAEQAGRCDGCSPDNCGGCMSSAAPAQAAPVDAPHSTACLYRYALSRLGLRDNAGLRMLFWDAHNSLSWDSKTDWYVMPDADRADCERCNAAIAAQQGGQ